MSGRRGRRTALLVALPFAIVTSAGQSVAPSPHLAANRAAPPAAFEGFDAKVESVAIPMESTVPDIVYKRKPPSAGTGSEC